METPETTLSKIVVGCLCEAGLVATRNEDKLTKKIASGKMTAEDWRLAVELVASSGPKP